MKTISEMLVDLRLDLKDGSTLWSDAELTRCIKRAVSDLSRFLPLEKSHEVTVDVTVTAESVTTPAATDIDFFVVAKDISASVAGDTCTLAAGTPGVPRPVRIAITDANASITLFTIIVKGRDADNHYIEESFYLSGGLIQTGKRYFKQVTEVEIDAISGNGAADVLNVGTGTHLGVYVPLANKPIKPNSDTITSYTRDTDYLMDYSNGKIAMKTGGTMVAATAYSITYTKSRICIDLTDLSDFIRVNRVEYPARNLPQTFISYEQWGRIITLAGGEAEGQNEVSDKEHAVIQYFAEHSPPATYSPGSYPGFLEPTIELAASAYAFLIKGVQHEHLSVTDLASLRTTLGLIAAVHTLAAAALARVYVDIGSAAKDAETALDKVANLVSGADGTGAEGAIDKIVTIVDGAGGVKATLDLAAAQIVLAATALTNINPVATPYLDDANTALDAAAVQAALAATTLALILNDGGTNYITNAKNSLTDANTQADLVATALAKVATYLENNTSNDAKALLTAITTLAADLRNAMETALDACAIALPITGAGIATGTADTTKDLPTAIATWTDEVKHIITGSAVPCAEDFLELGDDKINTFNIGNDVAQLYRLYGETALAMARTWAQKRQDYINIATVRLQTVQGYIQEVAARMSNLRSYIEQADAWGRVAQGFVAEGRGRAEGANALISEAMGSLAIVQRYIDKAARHNESAMVYIAEAQARVSIADRYIAEAQQRSTAAQAYVATAAQRLGMAEAYIAEASGRVTMARTFIEEGNSRLAEARIFVDETGGHLGRIDRYIAEAEQYDRAAALDLQLSDRFRTEAIERRNEAWGIWRDRSTYIGDSTLVSANQMPQPGQPSGGRSWLRS